MKNSNANGGENERRNISRCVVHPALVGHSDFTLFGGDMKRRRGPERFGPPAPLRLDDCAEVEQHIWFWLTRGLCRETAEIMVGIRGSSFAPLSRDIDDGKDDGGE